MLNLSSIITGIVLVAILVGAVYLTQKKGGKGAGCAGCSGCSHSASCENAEAVKPQ